MDDLSDYPVSLTEARAEKTRKCKDWTPRDALISLLRAIDAGETSIDAVVICYREVKGGERRTHFSMAAPDSVTGLGLLSRVSWMINET